MNVPRVSNDFNNERLRALAIVLLILITSGRLAAQQRDDDIPISSVPQNSPCQDQSKSLKELTDAFDSGRVPSPSELTGTWAAIGDFIRSSEKSMDCAGLKRGKKLFEEVMLADGYSLELHAVGTFDQKRTMQRNSTGSVSFSFDFGGDSLPVYRCRLTVRNTLACLIDVYRQGVEFRKMSVRPDEMAHEPRPR